MSEVKILLIGSDPEFLLRDKRTKELISSIGIIPGTKKEPVKVPELGKYYTIQIDNVLGEISVNPAKDGDELWNNIQVALEYIQNTILPENIEIFHASSGEYTDAQLDNDIAREFGCSESINAWTREVNNAPVAKDSNIRGCGCHIHLSYENPNPVTSYKIAQAFDLYSTLPSLFYDEDIVRRRFYGKAGEMRLSDYGLELRTLGGYLLSDKIFFDTAIEGLYKAIEFVNAGRTIDDESQLLTQIAINEQDKELAKEILEKYNIELLIKA